MLLPWVELSLFARFLFEESNEVLAFVERLNCYFNVSYKKSDIIAFEDSFIAEPMESTISDMSKFPEKKKAKIY